MLSKLNGLLITFEGTEGAGKSTLIREVEAELVRRGFSKDRVVLTREPGGSPVAERIRSTILEEKMDPWTELFLYEAARAEHLASTVLPALKRGAVVLCDRFTDSTLAYQAHARGLPWKDVLTLNRYATRGLLPHLTVWLDIDPKEGLKRAKDRNRFEAEGVKFQTKVRNGFIKARRARPDHWLRLKVGARVKDSTPEHLARAVVDSMLTRLKFGKKKRRG
jgi:dTMP kinase